MSNTFKIIILCFVGIACNTNNNTIATQYTEYVKDPRTGLCFAQYSPGSHQSMMTCVPCTPEVERLISPQKK